ncbi:RNA polymerase sigma factor [Agromyces rhizosphaerae]|uniref:RNA polymerase sigma factor n=1 Tax=Agromyces rhizosphaerae TaxID=88374 RepID=A0A9W6FQ05_9MICO|nr:RNA polymerase sigma factor [Agromyces rhizosphaerae]GLI28020.1 RNA polymerase sigma factor [Agromyces rhizosphaerae]
MTDATSRRPPDEAAVRRAVAAVWRIESAHVVATLTRMSGDFDLAEELAQEAFVEALEQWPRQGVPRNGGAWLTTTAKRRLIDTWRRRERLDERYRALARDLEQQADAPGYDPDRIDDDVLRLVFTACHPVLSREARVALTLRVVGGLTTEEIARAFVVPVATVQQRIVRAKKTLGAAHVPFAVPERDEFADRLGSVLGVLYLIFNEAHSASSGEELLRPELGREALRLARMVAELVPGEPEAHGLVALMEFTAARFPARVTADGAPVLLADQDRSRWDRSAIARGRAALARADATGRGRGAYGLQAAIAECHDVAASVDDTDWERIVLLYEALGRIAPSPVVELNRAVAVSMAEGPATALRMVDDLAASGALRATHLLPSVRGELLARLGRGDEARAEFLEAAARCGNLRERAVLERKAAEAVTA